MHPALVLLVSLLCPFTLEAAAENAAALYSPTFQPCPRGTPLVREVGPNPRKQTLSTGEAEYISGRRARVLPDAWAQYAANVHANTHAALPAYVDAILRGLPGPDARPTLGIATSGGGYRAAIFGAGILNALDGRNASSVRAGTGGLLQAATYLSGLSGGSWLIGSLAQADFPTLPDLLLGSQGERGESRDEGWLAEFDIFAPGDANVTAAFVGQLVRDIALKQAAGFPVTLTDVWGRALARHFVRGTTAANFFAVDVAHGAGVTLSDIAKVSSFEQRTQPFPIIIANSLTSRSNGSEVIEPGNIVPLMNPIYEFNVFESGSFDPSLGAFTPTKLLGSPNSSICTTAFDQLSLIQGISSDLFNGFNTSEAALKASTVGPIIDILQQTFPQQKGFRLDAAEIPNPFFGVSQRTFPDSDQTLLTLVDGGEDGEVVPIQPLLVKARGVDTIIALDAASDTTDSWADGSSIIATQHRAKLFPSIYSFPPVPTSASTFLSQNLTRRPTFFGCNSPSSRGDPLVIYLANGGPPLGQQPLTNTSTFQTQYGAEQISGMLDQLFDVATQGIPVVSRPDKESKDPQWPACLACAVVDRKRRSLGVSRSGVCEDCLRRYCWS